MKYSEVLKLTQEFCDENNLILDVYDSFIITDSDFGLTVFSVFKLENEVYRFDCPEKFDKCLKNPEDMLLYMKKSYNKIVQAKINIENLKKLRLSMSNQAEIDAQDAKDF